MPGLKFYCPTCSQRLEAEDDMFGTVISCPVCEGDIRVPYPDLPEPEQNPIATAGEGAKSGGRILAAGWACFGFGAVALLIAATASVPLPAPLFLIASCALGAWAIYRQRKIPGYALVISGMLLLPLSLVFVAQAFSVRARARFAEPTASPRKAVPTPEPLPELPEVSLDEPPKPDVAPEPEQHTPKAHARPVLKPAEPPPPVPVAVEPPEEEVAVVRPARPERKLSAQERKKIFALFMEADERATREAIEASKDADGKKDKKSQVQRQRKLAAKYKREIEDRFGLSAGQSREILAEGIDEDLEEIPD